MKVSSNPGAFRQPLVEPGAHGFCHLPQPDAIENPDNQKPGQDAQSEEPLGLVPGRCDGEAECRARFVPDSVVIARGYPEGILLDGSWRRANPCPTLQACSESALAPGPTGSSRRIRSEGSSSRKEVSDS